MTMLRIEQGCAYMLRDLQSAPAWNGQRVVVVNHLPEQDRYLVRPGDAAASSLLPPSLAVRAANLGIVDCPSLASISTDRSDDPSQHRFKPGAACVLQGLNAAVFNGQKVTVLQYLEDQNRYQVRPIATEGNLPAIMAIKPVNLRLDGPAEELPPMPISAAPPVAASSRQALKKQTSKRKVFSLFRKKSKDATDAGDDTETATTTPSPSPSPPSSPANVPDRAGGEKENLSSPPNDPAPLAFGGGGGSSRVAARPSNGSFMFEMSQSVPNLKLDTILEGDDTRHSRDGDDSNPHLPPPPPSQAGAPQQQQQQQQQARPPLRPRMGGLSRAGSVPCLASGDDSGAVPPRPARRMSGSSVTSTHSTMDPRLTPGTVAKLTGLTHQSFLNDLVVVVHDYSEQHGRYRVKIRDGDPALSAVNGKDLMIHCRNLLPIAVAAAAATASDDTSKDDSLSTSKPTPSTSAPLLYKVGDLLHVSGMALSSSMNGARVEVLAYDAFTKMYQVRPVRDSVESTLKRDVLNVRHENLSPPRQPDGARVVLTNVPGKPLLDGELGTVAYYQNEKEAYRVRLLGATAIDRNNGMELLDVPLLSARASPPSAMWVSMDLHGEDLRVPLSCHVESGALLAKLDVFAGVDRVVPTAKLLYGEDKCDWLNDDEVVAFLNENSTFTITENCSTTSSGMGNATIEPDCPFLEPMVEYELVQATGKVNAFKLLFPITETRSKVEDIATVTNSNSDEADEVVDDEDDDDDDDENPFLAQSTEPEREESSRPAVESTSSEPRPSQESQEEIPDDSMTLTDVFKQVEYDLVDAEEEETAPEPPRPSSGSSKSGPTPPRRPDPEEVLTVQHEEPESKPAEDPPRLHRFPSDVTETPRIIPRRERSELCHSWHSARSREASPSNRRPDPPGRQSHEAPIDYYKNLIQQRGRELASTRVGRAPESDHHRNAASERPRARSSSRATKKKKKTRSSSKVRSRSRSVTRSDFSLLSIPMLPSKYGQ
jgi:hypothetical protein